MTCKISGSHGGCKWQGRPDICLRLACVHLAESAGRKQISKSLKSGSIPDSVAKTPKYRNKRFERNGEHYNSEKEYRRHQELIAMEKAGEIRDLKREVPYELVPSVILAGRTKPAIRYYADMVYYRKSSSPGIYDCIVEDVKSPITRKNPVYRLKKHLLKHFFGIEIQEV